MTRSIAQHMTKRSRFFFALPALIAGLAAAWLVAAEHRLVPSPQALAARVQQITSPAQPAPAQASRPQNTRL